MKFNERRYSTTLEKSAAHICKFKYEYFLSKKNVVGIGFGYKITKGFRTCRKCIQVFVIKKVPVFRLLDNDIIPPNFNGIPTDVIETGIFTACFLREKIRPVLGGYSISAAENLNNGTAGCLVSGGNKKFILSTNHVLAEENVLPLGSPIVQPSYEYGGRGLSSIIGTLNKYIPLRFIEGASHPINLSDAAIGILNPSNILSPKMALIGNITCVKNAKLNDAVKKVGSTSELTEGIVTSVTGTIIVDFQATRRCIFQDIIITTRMSELGDSGSILLNKSNCALGILFSQAANNSTYCNLNTALDQLGVHLVTEDHKSEISMNIKK